MLHSVAEAIDGFQIMNPDLIFLDIQLSDGLSFEIFERSTSRVRLFSPRLMMNLH
jgi:DNA-binding LytR/AlgR family response regulator